MHTLYAHYTPYTPCTHAHMHTCTHAHTHTHTHTHKHTHTHTHTHTPHTHTHTPGLNDIDVEGEWLVQRQVLWKIPAEVLKSFEEKQEQVKEKKKQVWDFVTETDQSRGEVRGWDVGGR